MTDNTRALLKQALEALESLFSGKVDMDRGKRCSDAIQALRAELANPATPAWHDAPTGKHTEEEVQELLDLMPNKNDESVIRRILGVKKGRPA